MFSAPCCSGLGAPHGLLDNRPVVVSGRTPAVVDVTSLAGLWDSANTLQRSVQPDADAVRITQVVVEGQRRWIVQIPGTQQWGPIPGADPSDITTNIELMDDGQARINEAVLEAMRLGRPGAAGTAATSGRVAPDRHRLRVDGGRRASA